MNYPTILVAPVERAHVEQVTLEREEQAALYCFTYIDIEVSQKSFQPRGGLLNWRSHERRARLSPVQQLSHNVMPEEPCRAGDQGASRRACTEI